MASSHTCGQGQRLPLWRSSTTAASIHTVRCAGTPQPENSAYAAASSSPPQAAALAAGTARHRAGLQRAERRHDQPTTCAASQANMVMCRPEIDIR